MAMSTKITEHEYSGFQRAYDHFNAHLFKGILPQCLITLQRHPNARGYYHPEHFRGRKNDSKTDEIALNPDTFGGCSDEQILSTLVHEMCHLWEFHFAKRKSRAGYHNKEWGRKMMEIGLQPICFDTHINGVEKLSGQKMTHRIIENGMFEQVTTKLMAFGFQLNWQSGVMPRIPFSGLSSGNGDGDTTELPVIPMKWDKSKLKFICLSCNQKAWAKYTAALICGNCQKILFPDVAGLLAGFGNVGTSGFLRRHAHQAGCHILRCGVRAFPKREFAGCATVTG
ncbi:SprT-like domain-containing protein [Candidatus Woesearchaeota archaeon]|nr:SprT-like domain-containing protein [Candidatus Woesearchaeota archaeon]